MGIVGPHPESGVRVEAERPDTGPPWAYIGHAVTPTALLALQASISSTGVVEVNLPADAPAGLAERVRLILRAAYKHAEGEALPPPRRIVRWRADR